MHAKNQQAHTTNKKTQPPKQTGCNWFGSNSKLNKKKKNKHEQDSTSAVGMGEDGNMEVLEVKRKGNLRPRVKIEF